MSATSQKLGRHMKTKLFASLLTSLLLASSIRAANIAWVSVHSADNTPSTAAAGVGYTNAPDAGYTALLAASGHRVTRFVSVDNIDTAMLSDGVTPVLTAINTNDLIIISRSGASGHFQQANESAAWNGVAKPIMCLNGYIDRGSRLGFNTAETIPDVNSNPMRLRVNAPGHPIFAGVTLDAANTMVNPYSQRVTFTNANTGVTTLQVGISVVTSPVIAGGTVLATVGTAGDAAFGGMVIGEFPAGTTSQRTDVMAAKRLVSLTGSREAAPVVAEGAGLFDLQPDGAKLFLNAVTYLTTPQAHDPKFYSPLVGATNLVTGDAWTFNSPAVIGDPPLTYQWYQDGQPQASSTTLTFASLIPTDAGQYQLVVTNSFGSATSTVARLKFHAFAPDSITNRMISYWPLDAVLGNKTVDLVSSYDMTLNNLSGANIVAGKWNNAFQFNGTNVFFPH